MRLLTQYTTINKLLNALIAQNGLRSSPVQGIDKVRTCPISGERRCQAAQTSLFFWRKARVKKTGSEQQDYDKATTKTKTDSTQTFLPCDGGPTRLRKHCILFISHM